MTPALYEAKRVRIKEQRSCALCGIGLAPGHVLRVRWSKVAQTGRASKLAWFGYYHLESCGPAIVEALEETSQHRVRYEGSES